MARFSIWEDHEEQWDPTEIDEPKVVIDAVGPGHAAEVFAEDFATTGDHEVSLIVRENATGRYYKVLVVQSWSTDSLEPTTLEELRAP